MATDIAESMSSYFNRFCSVKFPGLEFETVERKRISMNDWKTIVASSALGFRMWENRVSISISMNDEYTRNILYAILDSNLLETVEGRFYVETINEDDFIRFIIYFEYDADATYFVLKNNVGNLK